MSFEDESNLTKFRREAANPDTEPSLKFMAMAVLAIAESCENCGRSFDIIKRLKGYKGTQAYHKVTFQVNDYIFDLSAHRILDYRVGLSKAVLWVDIHRNERTVRLTRFGSVIYDDDVSYEDVTKGWQLSPRDLQDSDIVGQTSRALAQVVSTCGFWNVQMMGGLMPGCVKCPYEFHCLLTPKYLINKKESR